MNDEICANGTWTIQLDHSGKKNNFVIVKRVRLIGSGQIFSRLYSPSYDCVPICHPCMKAYRFICSRFLVPSACHCQAGSMLQSSRQHDIFVPKACYCQAGSILFSSWLGGGFIIGNINTTWYSIHQQLKFINNYCSSILLKSVYSFK